MPRKKKVITQDEESYIEPDKSFVLCFLEAQAILNMNHDVLVKYAQGEPNIKKKQKALDKIDKILTLTNELYNQ